MAEIDPEEIARLLDGSLPPAAREALLREMENDPDLRALIADATHAMESTAILATPAPAPWRAAWVPWGLAAAAAIVAIAVPLLRSRSASPYATTIALPAGWNGTPWEQVRGVAPTLPGSARAVRIGARLVDLEAASDPQSFNAIREDLLQLLTDVPGASPAEALLRSASPRAASDALRAISALMPPLDLARGRELETQRLMLAIDTSASVQSSARRLLERYDSTAPTTNLAALRALLDSSLGRAAR